MSWKSYDWRKSGCRIQSDTIHPEEKRNNWGSRISPLIEKLEPYIKPYITKIDDAVGQLQRQISQAVQKAGGVVDDTFRLEPVAGETIETLGKEIQSSLDVKEELQTVVADEVKTGIETSYGKSREIIQCSDINSKEVAKVEEKVPVSDAVMKSLEGSGLTSDRIKEIRDLPKPDYSKGEFVNRDVNKPDPKTYLNPDYYQKHLEPFEKTGCYRIQRTDPMLPDDQYGGVLGHNSGLFVTSGEDMMKALKEADGDVSKLEKIFGMDEGDWGKNPVIIRVDDPQHLRIPDGNEMGAWTKYYIPGGFAHVR